MMGNTLKSLQELSNTGSLNIPPFPTSPSCVKMLNFLLLVSDLFIKSHIMHSFFVFFFSFLKNIKGKTLDNFSHYNPKKDKKLYLTLYFHSLFTKVLF